LRGKPRCAVKDWQVLGGKCSNESDRRAAANTCRSTIN
jgi:hypothetical protein